jgi:hypothetical protein
VRRWEPVEVGCGSWQSGCGVPGHGEPGGGDRGAGDAAVPLSLLIFALLLQQFLDLAVLLFLWEFLFFYWSMSDQNARKFSQISTIFFLFIKWCGDMVCEFNC